MDLAVFTNRPTTNPTKFTGRIMTAQTTKMILQSMITLSSAALGLVAALAWNDAIKATIKLWLSGDDGLASKYIYAVVATVIAVVVVLILSSIAARVGGESVINREVDS